MVILWLPSGNLLHSYAKKNIEIVDLPSLKVVIFHRYVNLPEGLPVYPIFRQTHISHFVVSSPTNEPTPGGGELRKEAVPTRRLRLVLD